MFRFQPILAVAAFTLLTACQTAQKTAAPAQRAGGLDAIQTIVVIYAENRAFDHLFGYFPGANGLQNLKPEQYRQRDRDGSVFANLPPVPEKGLTDPSDPKEITTEMTHDHPNEPFALDDPQGYGVDLSYKLHDLVHAFYQNQMQINGGKNDMFAAWSDAGGEVMGHFDGSKLAMWKVAKKYTLADNFFQGAFGGSFLNHQYLICACAPIDYLAKYEPEKYRGSIAVLNADNVSLAQGSDSQASAQNGPPKFIKDGPLTPKFYAVNTMQPPYQPSASLAPKGGDWRYADSDAVNTLTPQLGRTIGDELSHANVSWAWYAGGWQKAIAAVEELRQYAQGNKGGEVYTWPNATEGGAMLARLQFQYHHQPFNYYANFAPSQAARREHLRDGGMDGAKFIADIDTGKLPQVTFYKPQGSLNEHAGYATVAAGDEHIADIIAHLEKSPQWKNMVVIVTYDENGGWWDHLAPPKGDWLGPGSRIPAMVISPFAKRGYVDHTQYDTGSIQRLISHRFGLTPLPGIEQRDAALKASGAAPMGDLTGALDLPLR